MSLRSLNALHTASRPTNTVPPGFLHRQCSCGERTVAGGEYEKCRESQTPLQRCATDFARHVSVPPVVHDVLRSPGQPLDRETRSFFETRFDQDFSQVRLHTDTSAADSARAVNAKAYTVGNHIAFQNGLYDPSSAGGRRLLAHELTHVAQNQRSGDSFDIRATTVSHPSDASEREAALVSARVMNGDHATVAESANSFVHRDLGDTLKDVGIYAGIPAAAIGAGLGIAYLAGAFDSKEKKEAKQIGKQLKVLIDGATWKEIRKRVYPQQSAPGIQRAKERKAGRLPDLTGLGRISTLERFAGSVRNIQRHWNTTPDDRLRMLGSAANAELTAADVPPFLEVDKKRIEFKGFFTAALWRFTISEELVTAPTLNDTDAAEVANTTLHEGRHAEQQFLSARFAAGIEHKDSPTIAAEQGIPGAIADQAVAKKFDAGTDPAVVSMGRRMNQAMVTEGAQNQAISDDDGLNELATKRTDAQAALQTLQSNATAQTITNAKAKRDALSAQIRVVEQKYGLYRNIPYEADAHEVGDAAEEAFKGWPR